MDAKPILERFRLDGNVALVTGGGQGIGRAYVHALGEAGASVAIVDIDEESAKKVMAVVTDLQGAVVYLDSEVSDYMTGHDLIKDSGYCVL